MSKAEKTRAYIIEKSAPIFNRKGYAGTSLSEIIAATGLTKGAIYGNFENKDAIAVAVYKYNVRMLSKRLAEVMQCETSASAKLIAFTTYYRLNWKRVFARGGCPIQNASVEADDHISFLKKHVRLSIKKWVETIAGVIEEGQQSREFKKQLNAHEYAYTLIAILEGGIMLSKIMNNEQLLFTALDRMEDIVLNELKK